MTNEPEAEIMTRTILRIRFRRFGAAVWLAHLDLMRTFERSVRRAGIPVRWSAGFNPRPDLVFALPIGVGLETCADTVDIGLDGSDVDPDTLLLQLNQNLPAGLSVEKARLMPAAHDSIMSRIAAADYELETRQLAQAARTALEMEKLMIDKPSKGKTIQVDIRPLVLLLETDGDDRIRIRVKAGSRENLRPDLFLAALVKYGDLAPEAAADARMVRTGLYLTGRTAETGLEDSEGIPMPDRPANCPEDGSSDLE